MGSHGLCAGIQAWPRIPGHDHTSLGTATCPWGCNKHDPGHGRGSGPLLSPGTPGMSPPEGSLLGLQPSHRIRAGMVPGGLCRRGCAGGAVPSLTPRVGVLGLPPHSWDCGPSPMATTGRWEGSGPPSSVGTGAGLRQGEVQPQTPGTGGAAVAPLTLSTKALSIPEPAVLPPHTLLWLGVPGRIWGGEGDGGPCRAARPHHGLTALPVPTAPRGSQGLDRTGGQVGAGAPCPQPQPWAHCRGHQG